MEVRPPRQAVAHRPAARERRSDVERVRADRRAVAAGRESHDAGRSEQRSAAFVACLSIESHALALVALFTGGFFVYSTQSLATLRRRREFAVLHALGVTRGQQLALVLAGSAIIGTCGAVLGVMLGLVAARVGLDAIGGDLGAGYFPRPRAGSKCVAGDRCVLRARRAGCDRRRLASGDRGAHADRGGAQAGDERGVRAHARPRRCRCSCSSGALVLLLPPIAGLPLPGFVAIALLMIGAVIAMPSIVRMALRHAPFARGVPYQVAIAQIAGTARYATLSVSAILVSFSLMVSMAIMVTSFRTSLDHWTQRILPADVYVRLGLRRPVGALDASTVQRIGHLPGGRVLPAVACDRAQLARSQPVALVARSTRSRRLPTRSG